MEPAGIALRLLVYVQSAMMLGILLFAGSWTRQTRLVALGIAAVGVVLTIMMMAGVAASFSENGAFFELPTLHLLLTQTAMGWAAIARIVALMAVIALVLNGVKRAYPAMFAIAAIVSLSWNGHGAINDDLLGKLHLAGNAVHLIAGLGWIGAIAGFWASATSSAKSPPELAARLQKFATTGLVFVVLLMATGIGNTLFIVGFDALPTLLETNYGLLLIVKVGLFAAMLAAAAANRFWLTPRLKKWPHLAAVRMSLGGELVLGIAVLAVVAWLGTLDPLQSAFDSQPG